MSILHGYEEKRNRDHERIQRFRLLDDDFMTKVFEDIACAELLLRIILGRNDITVIRSTPQLELKNLQGRSVRLDIFAEDAAGRFFNVEVQRTDRGAGFRRARYNSSLMDASITLSGEGYEKLCDTYVIFITERDVIGKGLPIYHIDKVIRETGDRIEDGAYTIYVNSRVQDDTALGKLMHGFSVTSADHMNYRVLAERVRYFKEDQEGVSAMCRMMEDMRNEAAREAAITTTIAAGRRYGASDEVIRTDIMKQFQLTGTQADRYLAELAAEAPVPAAEANDNENSV